VLCCSDVGLIHALCIVSICVLSADNITFAVHDLCISQRLRSVRLVLCCSDGGLIHALCVVSICVLSADNITFAVHDLCTSQRLRSVRHVGAED